MALEITAARPDPALLDLPWRVPLEEWPEDILAALPRGISRHVVRFVRLSGRVLAVKEIRADIARHEYDLLRSLNRLHMPCVEPFAVVSGRIGLDGEPLDACLITRHLQFSLPYRALYSQNLRKGTAIRLIDALAVLLVRLHLAGFWWGDVSLSNTLFRRDAGAFAAYLVDAETGELRERLSDGQREHDLDIARVNIAGELMDLEAGGLLQEDRDPVAVSERMLLRYRELWDALTGSELIDDNERWRVDDRIRRLNALGFDVDELAITTDIGGTSIQIQPKVVDAGPPLAAPVAAHRSRRAREPGPPAAQRPRRLHRGDRAPGGGRGDRRPRLAGQHLRAGHPARAAGARLEARAGRGVPRGARAPVVHGRARAARHPHRGGDRGLRRLGAAREARRAGRARCGHA